MILDWRNQEEVRKNSFTDHIIEKKEHYLWWENIKDDQSKKWYLFYMTNKPCAVVNFYNIKSENTAFWGFYLADTIQDYEKLKIWFGLEKAVAEHARNCFKLKNIKCELFRFNKAALFMHNRSGYREIDSYAHNRGEVVVMQMDIITDN